MDGGIVSDAKRLRPRYAGVDRIRAARPRLGLLLHALTDDQQSTRAPSTGAPGEERLGARLDELSTPSLRVLHDRRIPGTRADIDHLAVTPTGVHVIEVKRYAGRPRLAVEGGLLRPRVERLMVGSRDCTPLVDGVLEQVKVVRGVVGETVQVHGVLCFVEADWPLLGRDIVTRTVSVLLPRRLYSRLRADGPLDLETVDHLHRALAAVLTPA